MLHPLEFPYWVRSFRVCAMSCSSPDNIGTSNILLPIGSMEIGLKSVMARGGFTFGIGTISVIL